MIRIRHLALILALIAPVAVWAQAPTPILLTDRNGNQVTVSGATTGVQVGAPTPAVLTDANGNALVYGSVSLPTLPGVVVSTSCGSAANCFAVSANTRWVGDANITNTTPTVTSATIAFTQADVGRSIFTVNPSTGLTKLTGTILSVQSATSATASANATATENSSTDILCVGTDDTAQLVAAWTYAVNNGGLTVSLPSGNMLVSAQPFIFTGTANPKGSYGIIGQGGYGSGTVFVLSPSYNFAGMASSAGMLYNYAPVSAQDNSSSFHIWPRVGYFSVTGLSSAFTGASPVPSAVIYSQAAGVFQDIQIAGFGAGVSGMAGITVGTEARIYNLDCQPNFAAGTTNMPCITNIAGSSYIDIYSPIAAFSQGFGIHLQQCTHCNVYGGIMVNVGSGTGINPHASIYVHASQNVRLYGVRFNGGVTGGTEPAQLFVDGTSEAECIGCRFENSTAASNSIWVASGGKLKLQNVDMSAVTGSTVGIDNIGSIFDECGNVFAGSSTIYTGAGVLYGSCSITGSAAASGNWALSGGWGTTAALTSITGNTQRTRYTLTASGTGQGANPTITHTFATPFIVAPVCSIKQDGGTQPAVANPFTVGVPTATSVVYTYTGTPGASNTLFLEEDCSNP